MNLDKFTYKAQEAFSTAQDLAVRSHNQQIEEGHLFLSLLQQDDEKRTEGKEFRSVYDCILFF